MFANCLYASLDLKDDISCLQYKLVHVEKCCSEWQLNISVKNVLPCTSAQKVISSLKNRILNLETSHYLLLVVLKT